MASRSMLVPYPTSGINSPTCEYCHGLPPLFSDVSSEDHYPLRGSLSTRSSYALCPSQPSTPTSLVRYSSLSNLLALNTALESTSISAYVNSPVITLSHLAALDCQNRSKYLPSTLSPPRRTFIQIKGTSTPLFYPAPCPPLSRTFGASHRSMV